jgi:hypothetical protein
MAVDEYFAPLPVAWALHWYGLTEAYQRDQSQHEARQDARATDQTDLWYGTPDSRRVGHWRDLFWRCPSVVEDVERVRRAQEARDGR